MSFGAAHPNQTQQQQPIINQNKDTGKDDSMSSISHDFGSSESDQEENIGNNT